MSTQPLVLLHGWASSPRIWDRVVEHLTIPVVRPQLSAQFALNDWADSVATNLPDGALIAGWSLGGMLAMRIARLHPHKCAALALIATTPCFTAKAEWPHGLDTALVSGFRTAYASNPARTLKRFVALQALGHTPRESIVAELTSALAPFDPADSAMTHGLALLESLDLRSELPCEKPCLIVQGEEDAVVPATTAQWLHSQWQGSTMQLLAGAGHATMLSHAETLAASLEEYRRGV